MSAKRRGRRSRVPADAQNPTNSKLINGQGCFFSESTFQRVMGPEPTFEEKILAQLARLKTENREEKQKAAKQTHSKKAKKSSSATDVEAEIKDEPKTRLPQGTVADVPHSLTADVSKDVTEDLKADIPHSIMGEIPYIVTVDIQQNVKADIPDSGMGESLFCVTVDIPQNVTADTPQNLKTDILQNVSTNITQNLTADILQNVAADIPHIMVQMPYHVTANISESISEVNTIDMKVTHLELNPDDNLQLSDKKQVFIPEFGTCVKAEVSSSSQTISMAAGHESGSSVIPHSASFYRENVVDLRSCEQGSKTVTDSLNKLDSRSCEQGSETVTDSLNKLDSRSCEVIPSEEKSEETSEDLCCLVMPSISDDDDSEDETMANDLTKESKDKNVDKKPSTTQELAACASSCVVSSVSSSSQNADSNQNSSDKTNPTQHSAPFAPDENFSMQHSTSYVQDINFSMQHSAPCAPNENYSMLNSTPYVQDVNFPMQHSAPCPQNENYSMQQSTPNVPDEKYLIQQSAPYTNVPSTSNWSEEDIPIFSIKDPTEPAVQTSTRSSQRNTIWSTQEEKPKEQKKGAEDAKQVLEFRHSDLLKAEHAKYLILYNKYVKGFMQGTAPSVLTADDIRELSMFEKLQSRVIKEQEEFQGYLKENAIRNPKFYLFLKNPARFYTANKISAFKLSKKHINVFSQINQLKVPFVQISDPADMVFKQTLLEVGLPPKIVLPDIQSGNKPVAIPTKDKKISAVFPTRKKNCPGFIHHEFVSCDENVKNLACKYKIPVVMSSSVVKCLFNNHGPNYDRAWNIPVIIKDQVSEGEHCRVVYLDKPIFEDDLRMRDYNAMFHKYAVRTFISHPNPKLNKTLKQLKNFKTDLGSEKTLDDPFDMFSSSVVSLETFGSASRSAANTEFQVENVPNGRGKKRTRKSKYTDYDGMEATESVPQGEDCGVRKVDSVKDGVETSEDEEPLSKLRKVSSVQVSVSAQGDKLSCQTPSTVQGSKSSGQLEVAPGDNKSSENTRSRRSCRILSKDIYSSETETEDLQLAEKKLEKGDSHKEDIAVGSNDEDKNTDKSVVVKRKRGRPKKASHEKATDNESHSEKEILNENEMAAGSTETFKRRRGRPKKVVAPESIGNVDLPVASPQVQSSTSIHSPLASHSTKSPITPHNIRSPTTSVRSRSPNTPHNIRSPTTPHSPESPTRCRHIQEIPTSPTSDEPATSTVPTRIIPLSPDSSPLPKKHLARTAKATKPPIPTNFLSPLDSILGPNKSNQDSPGSILSQEDPSEFLPPTESHSSILYNLWRIGTTDVLIRCRCHGVLNTQKGTKPVYISPKMEYQTCYGLEQVTLEEMVKSWTSCFIRNNTNLLRVRINAFTSQILMYEELQLHQMLQSTLNFKPSSSFEFVNNLLKQLTGLECGSYLVSHEPGADHCVIKFEKKITSDVSERDEAMHQPKKKRPVDEIIPWIPIDPTLLLPYHVTNNRIPATFLPKDAVKKFDNKNGNKGGNQNKGNDKKHQYNKQGGNQKNMGNDKKHQYNNKQGGKNNKKF